MKRQWLSVALAVAVGLLLSIGASNTPASAASFVVTNLNDAGPGSLRDAVNLANASPGADTITFGVSGVINPVTSLNLSDPGTTIDGSGQNIVLDASTMSPNLGVLMVTTSSATFKKLTIQNAHVNGIAVNANCAVAVDSLTLDKITLQNIAQTGVNICAPTVNHVAIVDSTIQAAQGGMGNGVNIGRDLPGGGTGSLTVTNLFIARSTISGQSGVSLNTRGAANTLTATNVVIVDSTITGSTSNAVSIIGSKGDDPAKLVVKDVTLRGNTLTGQTAIRIGQPDAVTTNNHITITTNKSTGTTGSAVMVAGASNNAIMINDNALLTSASGSPTVSVRGDNNANIAVNHNRTISNTGTGSAIWLEGLANENVSISQNTTIVAGGTAIGFSANDNTNLIVAANKSIEAAKTGVYFGIKTGASNNRKIVISGNTIKVGATSFGVDLGVPTSNNTEILINNNTATGGSAGIRIAGANPGKLNGSLVMNDLYQNKTGIMLNASGFVMTGNKVHDNFAIGVLMQSGTGNLLAANSIYSNGGIGIDLGDYKPTPNDPGDVDTGPNNLQNYPELTLVKIVGIKTQIAGALNSTPNAWFTIQFFSNPTCHASGFGEGKTLIGATMVKTDATGNAKFNVTLLGQAIAVSATATDVENNTSEFSKCVVATK